ncbi:MAG: zf-HC2 domain-containing protein [Candidatus Omnitrophica bacterium]|nr:zf-HC2 domain-containing protein [Candidatus Omnitrophota bacterium]
MSQGHKIARSQVTDEHPTDIMLADYLDNLLSDGERDRIEAHLAACNECRIKIVSAYESVKNKRKAKRMGRINLYLIFAIISFLLSFLAGRFFLQFLVATLLLGAKWVADSKSARMLVMIHEACKNGGEREASEVIKRLDSRSRIRI